MNLDRFRETLIRDEGLNLNRHTVEEIDHIGYGFNLEIEWDDELLDYLDVNDEDEIQSLTGSKQIISSIGISHLSRKQL